MKTLHLTLKKKWFDMTESGEKPEEYRELKDYWGSRLCYKVPVPWGGYMSKWAKLKEGDFDCLNDDFIPNFEPFDAVQATNGYGKTAPSWKRECLGIEIREGRPEWGAEPGKKYFVIKLGKVIPLLLLTLFLFSCVSSKPVPPKHVSPKIKSDVWK